MVLFVSIFILIETFFCRYTVDWFTMKFEGWNWLGGVTDFRFLETTLKTNIYIKSTA